MNIVIAAMVEDLPEGMHVFLCPADQLDSDCKQEVAHLVIELLEAIELGCNIFLTEVEPIRERRATQVRHVRCAALRSLGGIQRPPRPI